MDNALEKLADLALELQEATHMALRSPVDKKSPVKIKITICTGPVVTSKPTHMDLRSPDRQNEFCQDEDPHLPWSSSFW